MQPSIRFSVGMESLADTTNPGQEIHQQSLPVGLSYESNRSRFEISLPYIQRTAPSGKVAKSHHHDSKIENSTTVGAPTPIVPTSGLGDVMASFEYRLLDEAETSLSLSAKGEVKLATADVATGLGTGVNDYFGELGVSRDFNNLTLEAHLGYAVLGSPGNVRIEDVQQTLYFNNIFYGSTGLTWHWSDALESGLSLALGQPSETGGTGQRDLTLALEYRFTPHTALHFEAGKSLIPGVYSTVGTATLSFSQ
ncbi:MAG: hypothetical protein Fur0040_11010 [Sideroxydans sp.]